MSTASLVQRFARRGEQAAVLQGGWRLFQARGCSGAICYRLHFGTALVPGEPLCAVGDTQRVLAEFLSACDSRRWHAVFTPVGAAFAEHACARGCSGWKIGETPALDLQTWQAGGRRGAPLRAALNRARRAGVEAHEWHGENDRSLSEASVRSAHAAWQHQKGAVPLGFVLGANPLTMRPGRRWFVARRGGAVEAIAVTAALPAVGGVAIEHFMRRPGAEYGSVETAIVAALCRHRTEGVKLALLGVAPLRGLPDGAHANEGIAGPPDRGHRAGLAVLRALRHHNALYAARSLEHFKAKFIPARWEADYLVHYPARVLPRMAVAAAWELVPGGPGAWAFQLAAAAAGAAGRTGAAR